MTERENKSEEQKKPSDRHRETDEKINCWIDTESAEYIKQVMTEHHCNKTTAIQIILKERNSPILETSMPQEIKETSEKCKKKACLAYPHFDSETKQVICVFPFEGKEPKILTRSIVQFKACSDTPILVSMARKKDLEEDFQYRIETLNAQIDRADADHPYNEALREKVKEKDAQIEEELKPEIHRIARILEEKREEIDKLHGKLKPMQDLLTERDTLNSKVSDMENALLKRDEKIAILETDNEQQRKTIEELSHDILVETNRELTSQLEEEKQGRKVQLAQKDSLIEEYKTEIQKLEALNETQQRKMTEVTSETRKFLRNAKQFTPTSPVSYTLDYVAFAIALRKAIENFEGYLQTIAS